MSVNGNKARRGEPLATLQSAIVYAGDECLVWPHSHLGNGYGTIWREGKNRLVHRIVCKAAHGVPPTPKHQAAHSCGNRLCVNSRHLRWATSVENEADKLAHGTRARGSRQGSAKLTEKDVRKIRALRGQATHVDIAKQFGVGPSAICDVYTGRQWGWLP